MALFLMMNLVSLLSWVIVSGVFNVVFLSVIKLNGLQTSGMMMMLEVVTSVRRLVLGN